MVRKVTPSQLQSMIRQKQQRLKQAINKYNQDVRQYNQKRQQAINSYNNEVRKHNARVHTYRKKIATELNRLQSQRTSVRYKLLRTSTLQLNSSYSTLESKEDSLNHLDHSSDFLDLSEQENANSLSVSNILEENENPLEEADPNSLKNSNIENHLTRISPELDDRWRGALFSLNPHNPDAARHFCTSSREIFSEILDSYAPNDQVIDKFPNCDTTDQGTPTRKSKIHFILSNSGINDNDAIDFVDKDINNILTLFRVFNDGTHGSSGRFDITQLISIKSRVEDGIIYLSKICNYV